MTVCHLAIFIVRTKNYVYNNKKFAIEKNNTEAFKQNLPLHFRNNVILEEALTRIPLWGGSQYLLK